MDELASFYLINATSLVNYAALQQLATELNVGTAIISETWLNTRHLDQFVSVDGCLVFREDRFRKKCGA
jgi:hypothetical protein